MNAGCYWNLGRAAFGGGWTVLESFVMQMDTVERMSSGTQESGDALLRQEHLDHSYQALHLVDRWLFTTFASYWRNC